VRWGQWRRGPSLGGIAVVFQEEEAGRRKWRSLFLWCRWLACTWLLVAAGSNVVVTWIDAWRGRVHPVEWIWW